MSIRKRLGRVRSRIKGVFQDSPDASTSSLPIIASTSSSVNPTPIVSAQGYLKPGTKPLDDRARSTSALPDIQATSSDVVHARSGSTPAYTPTTPLAESQTRLGDVAWKCLDEFTQTLGGFSGFGPLKSIMEELSRVVNIYDKEAEARSQYVALRNELEQLFSELSTHFSGNLPPTMTTGMNSLCAAIEGELDRIVAKEERRTERRFLEASEDLSDVIECYHRIQGHLERLKINADLSMWKIVDEQASESRLRALSPSRSAQYNSAQAQQVGRRECTPRTREQVLIDLQHWVCSKQQDNLYWLNGMAGTGKTTIASSLCVLLDRSQQLGASFFCTRLLPECRNVNLVLPTLAYQLARFSRPFYHSLSSALQEDPDLHTKALPNQLQGLIVDPLRKAAPALPEDLVLVIDALDECEDSQGIALLLEILAVHASGLPIKIFVSSRPEPQIRRKIGDAKSKLILHELEASIVKQDIELYLNTELRGAGVPISDSDLQTIVRKAGVLFIYAATVVRYIQAADEAIYCQERIQEVLSTASSDSDKNQDIDSLYSAIVGAAFNDKNLRRAEKANLRLVLDTVVCAQEPVTVEALAKILQLGDGSRVRAALKPFWSVIHIHGVDELVTTLHASFPDYMLNPTRSGANGCQMQTHHGQLADLCLDRIEINKCQFNICGLRSSFILDEEEPDLHERIKLAIPQDLWYACRYWAVHLKLGRLSAEHLRRIDDFVANRLLLWMEVLNLKKQMHVGAPILELVESWCKEGNAPSEMKDLVHDAWRFITMFTTNDVSRSTPHLYLSMLASWSRSESLAGCYTQRAIGLPMIEGPGMTRRQLALLGALNADGEITSVAFSADGLRMVSGSSDCTVQVWDAKTGKPLFDKIRGHTYMVSSVAFSPDGMCVVSGSYDSTVRVWDAHTGKPALDPLEGHTDWVMSVAFSPVGMRIASGSVDQTIRVWDAQTGKPILNPFNGHTGSVRSVEFSPDGMRIVSGSADQTIRVWDAQTGNQLLNPLEGHTERVTSVSFSPDGVRIASGSADETLRVWDAGTGELLLEPLKGHDGWVYSVAFSPDNMYIVSGSSDSTVRVWSTQTGNLVFGPLKGHTDLVGSVTFSPDCMRIISGSHDKTIRVWDAQAGKPLPDPLSGHFSSVNAVSFSPDSTRIVSGSSDNTIKIWNAKNGEPLLDELRGHASSVTSVTFSPDGRCIVSGSEDKTMRLWDAQTGEPLSDTITGHKGAVMAAAFSPNSLCIVTGSHDHTIQVWDARTGKPLLDPLRGHTSCVTSVVFSPDGTRLASGSHDQTVRVWDAQTGKSLLGPLGGDISLVLSVSFSTDGRRIVSGSGDRAIRVWDAQTGSLLLGPLTGHAELVTSVVFSPDGMRVVSGSWDKTIRVWDSRTGELLLGPLRGHTGFVTSVALSPDGSRIASASGDGVIRTWNMGTSISQPTTSEQSHADYSSWTVDERGWVRDERQRPLLWLPPDLKDRVVLSNTGFLISPEGSVTLNFENAKLGESWTECYIPCPPIVR